MIHSPNPRLSARKVSRVANSPLLTMRKIMPVNKGQEERIAAHTGFLLLVCFTPVG
jgi:hypothetical protein